MIDWKVNANDSILVKEGNDKIKEGKKCYNRKYNDKRNDWLRSNNKKENEE